MSWTSPKTWATGDALSVANLNTEVRDNLRWLAGDTTSSTSGRPACRVYNSANISVSSGSAQVLTFDSEQFDVFGMHSTSVNTGRITIPSGGGGLYMVGGTIEWQASSTSDRVGLLVRDSASGNAITYQMVPGTTETSTPRLTVATLWEMAEGAFFTLEAFQDTGGALNVLANTGFSPHFWAIWMGDG